MDNTRRIENGFDRAGCRLSCQKTNDFPVRGFVPRALLNPFAPSPFLPYKYRLAPLTTIHSRLPLLPSIAPPPNFSAHRYRFSSLLPHSMAAVSGLAPPRHPSPFRKAQKISRPSATTTAHGPTSVRRLPNLNLKQSHALVSP